MAAAAREAGTGKRGIVRPAAWVSRVLLLVGKGCIAAAGTPSHQQPQKHIFGFKEIGSTTKENSSAGQNQEVKGGFRVYWGSGLLPSPSSITSRTKGHKHRRGHFG